MDWAAPHYLIAIPPVVLLLWWFQRRSLRPLAPARRRALFAVRAALVAIVLLALARPGWETTTRRQAVVFLLDHSQSQGVEGMHAAHACAARLAAALPGDTPIGLVSAGSSAVVRRAPQTGDELPPPDERLLQNDGAQSDLAAGVSLACGLFPPDAARRLVLIGDGQQTRGDLSAAAREAALRGVVLDAVPIAGRRRPDVRVVRLASSRSRSHEGASIELRTDLESSLTGKGRLRLFENGIEVESRPLELSVGGQHSETFRRTPPQRNLYTYRACVEGFTGDAIVENDEAMALVDVRGRPLLLYVEGEPQEARYLARAMQEEGIRLQERSPEAFPQSLQELAGYDGLVLSDVPAHQLTDRAMAMIRDYVEKLGGGFVMVGGKNSFGVGGYYRTPVEDVLPVKMKAADEEEQFATALALVLDRSGSMSGQKIEICKSAAIATVDLLSGKDYVGVVAFDSEARWIVPMTQATSKDSITAQISTLNAGGGTNAYPAMVSAGQELAAVKTKVKHMLVLTDGQTEGSGYQGLAAQLHAAGTTISTVAIGDGADTALLQAIAAAGGGTFYATYDPGNLPRIFTQDAMVHMGRLIREEAFTPRQIERHPMLKGCDFAQAPTLLGYVKTDRKATAQVPLVTDVDDPLLAHWQFGLGKVTAFTSDCKSRWSALWISGWPGYSQFWAQVLRDTARKPQSQTMDLRLEEGPRYAEVLVDLWEDPAHFRNEAAVAADIYFVAAGAAGSSMKPLEQLQLDQTGPGRYRGRFAPDEPGVYLVRARCGAEVVSAGLVHQPSGETATGQVNQALLAKACEVTGGRLLDPSAASLPPLPSSHVRYLDATPLLVRLFLLLFLIDVAIRRWENIQAMLLPLDRFRGGKVAKSKSHAPRKAVKEAPATPLAVATDHGFRE